MKSKTIYDSDNSTGVLLDRASQLMRLGLNRKFTGTGCQATAEQWKILLALWQADGISQQELADNVFKSKASMTKLIDGLESRGLVSRRAAPEDRRQKRIYLSPKGIDELETLMVQAKRNLAQAELGIPELELQVFKHVLKQIISNMEQGNVDE